MSAPSVSHRIARLQIFIFGSSRISGVEVLRSCLLNRTPALEQRKKGPPLLERPLCVNVAILVRDQKKNFTASCITRWPCFSVTVPKVGVFNFPVVPSKPRFRLVPLNDHNGWF